MITFTFASRCAGKLNYTFWQSIMDEDDPSKLDLLYDPVQMLLAFEQLYGHTPVHHLSLGRINGRHARILDVKTGQQAEEGGFHYRF